MPAKLTIDDIKKQIEALKSGEYKWKQPGSHVDMTESRIKQLTKQLERMQSKKGTTY